MIPLRHACIRSPIKSHLFAFYSKQLPVSTEVISHKRWHSSYDHFLKYGHGGRNSFNGTVATVFGATGFLGRYVVNRLARTGSQIIVPYRGIEDDFRHIRVIGDLGQIVFVNYDLRDEESVAKTMTHSNVVINLIGRNHPTRNFTLHDCHVKGASTIAKAASANNVDKLIHISALGAQGDSPSLFMRIKAQGEKAVIDNFPDATILKPAECYGAEDDYFNRYAYMRQIPLGIPLVGGGMSTTKRPVYIVDVAEAVVNAIKNETARRKSFELYGPEEYYLYDMVKFIFRTVRRPFRTVTVPAAFYSAIGYLGELSPFAPRITRDRAVRQFLSETVSDDAYTFEDLGITPMNMNEIALALLRRHRHYYYHDEVFDEELDTCKPVPAK